VPICFFTGISPISESKVIHTVFGKTNEVSAKIFEASIFILPILSQFQQDGKVQKKDGKVLGFINFESGQVIFLFLA